MAIELKAPTVGESITEVQISQWLKSEGDLVQKDEPIVVLESEKAAVEVPAPESGKLSRILHQTGETVGVGTAIAQIEQNGGSAPAPAAPASKREAPRRAPARKNQPAQDAQRAAPANVAPSTDTLSTEQSPPEAQKKPDETSSIPEVKSEA